MKKKFVHQLTEMVLRDRGLVSILDVGETMLEDTWDAASVNMAGNLLSCSLSNPIHHSGKQVVINNPRIHHFIMYQLQVFIPQTPSNIVEQLSVVVDNIVVYRHWNWTTVWTTYAWYHTIIIIYLIVHDVMSPLAIAEKGLIYLGESSQLVFVNILLAHQYH